MKIRDSSATDYDGERAALQANACLYLQGEDSMKGGTADHSGENSKVHDIHDVLINIRSNVLAALVEKSGFSSFPSYIENV